MLVLVESQGRVITKEELINRVWPRSVVSDGNFHVTLDAVRKALGESGREPHFIFRTAGGYKFVADVREVAAVREQKADVVSGREAHLPSKHLAHVVVAAFLYSTLYAVAVLLEVTYQFDRFGRMALWIAPAVLTWMTLTSAAALAIDRKWTLRDRTGLAASVLTLLIAAAVLFGALTLFLPSFPITESTLQAYPAQAAYLKDMSYFLVLGFIYMILPFHFIISAEREIVRRKHSQVEAKVEEENDKAAQRIPYWSFWALVVLLLVFLVMSVAMTARLLDNLKPGPYQNLFVELVYLRALLFFGLGIECLVWYHDALDRVKRANRFVVRNPVVLV
jgi:hypothetical protein